MALTFRASTIFLRRQHDALPTGPVHGVLYSKPDCGLCDEARDLVGPIERTGRLQVTEIDISSTPELLRQYGLIIPVLMIEGRPPLLWPFDRHKIERALL